MSDRGGEKEIIDSFRESRVNNISKGYPIMSQNTISFEISYRKNSSVHFKIHYTLLEDPRRFPP